MDWPYYTLKDGKLVDEEGNVQFEDKMFKDVDEAEQFLIDNDYRGNVQSSIKAEEVEEDEETKKLKYALLDIIDEDLDYKDLSNIVIMWYDEDKGVMYTQLKNGELIENKDESFQDKDEVKKYLDKVLIRSKEQSKTKYIEFEELPDNIQMAFWNELATNKDFWSNVRKEVDDIVDEQDIYETLNFDPETVDESKIAEGTFDIKFDFVVNGDKASYFVSCTMMLDEIGKYQSSDVSLLNKQEWSGQTNKD